MTATATSSKQSTIKAHGAVRISLPAHVANDSNKLKQSIHSLVERVGCLTCFSGADCRFQAERDFVVDSEGKFATLNQHPDPQPWLTTGANSTITVALGKSVQFDIEKVFQAVDKVNGLLGCPSCHSGFDIQYQNEVATIGINNELQAVQYGV
ncbi:MAG TPA: hypothetical protein VKT33_00290 [Candidatus Angelobacter sp.]|nr:hypothetical protein [Candidatus Angelobacter sp.]